MSEQLKPCPFCGGRATIEIVEDPCDCRLSMKVQCYGETGRARCETICETFMFATEREAIDAWNTRATPAGYVTEEECKRRCYMSHFQGAHDIPQREVNAFDEWYAANFETEGEK